MYRELRVMRNTLNTTGIKYSPATSTCVRPISITWLCCHVQSVQIRYNSCCYFVQSNLLLSPPNRKPLLRYTSLSHNSIYEWRYYIFYVVELATRRQPPNSLSSTPAHNAWFNQRHAWQNVHWPHPPLAKQQMQSNERLDTPPKRYVTLPSSEPRCLAMAARTLINFLKANDRVVYTKKTISDDLGQFVLA